jgi:hypothetical protein
MGVEKQEGKNWTARIGVIVLVLNLGVTAIAAFWSWKYQATSLALTAQQSLLDTKLKQIDLSVQEAKNAVLLETSRLGFTEATVRLAYEL